MAVSLLYGAELLDELIYGAQGAALPQLKGDLGLSYTEVALLFAVPGFVSLLTDPLVGLLGDTRCRRWLILGGLGATVAGLVLTGFATSFVSILLAFTVLYLASGAYVNLAQATLIDRDLTRSEQVMARWTLLGSAAVTVAPVVVTALALFGYGWRGLFLGLAGTAGIYTLLLSRQRIATQAEEPKEFNNLPEFVHNLWAALQTRELLRWVILTQLADLMLDRLLEVTGLYFGDVVKLGPSAAGAVVVFTIAGLVGNVLLLPVLNRESGVRILRLTALLVVLSYAVLLLAPVVWIKLAALALVSFLTAGWFPILRAQCYRALPGQSGLVVAVTSLDNVSSLLVPLIIGQIADAFGLQWAMWLLIAAPLALMVGLPARR